MDNGDTKIEPLSLVLVEVGGLIEVVKEGGGVSSIKKFWP